MRSADVYAAVVARYRPGARLISATELPGGLVSEIVALTLSHGTDEETVVLRRHGDDVIADKPDIARKEAALLGILEAEGLNVAGVCYFDRDSDLLGGPYLLLRHVAPGEPAPDAASRGVAIAEELARIHHIRGDDPRIAFLPLALDVMAIQLAERPAVPDEDMSETKLRAALMGRWPPPQLPPVLLHGDCWMGNLIWKDGRIAAVLDWEDAMRGDPRLDLGIARLEILWIDGEEGVGPLTARYAELTGVDLKPLPLYDLAAAFRPVGRISGWGLDTATYALMRERHFAFVARAIAAL
jgi:aminoglycoside phosphotransferase (APT) family kinase protein